MPVTATVTPVNRIVTVGALALAVSLSACGGAEPAEPAASSSAAGGARSEATLKQALLAAEDLPAGYTIETKAEDDGATPVARSDDPSCQTFVRLINAESLPGSKASALAAFAGGQQGPFVEEWLEAMDGPASVEKVQSQLEGSVEDCAEVTVSLPGSGAADMKLTAADPPAVGSNPLSYRMTAKGGALDGFEITFVHTRVGDTLLTMNFVSIDPAAIDDLLGAAHEKATTVLKVSAG